MNKNVRLLLLRQMSYRVLFLLLIYFIIMKFDSIFYFLFFLFVFFLSRLVFFLISPSIPTITTEKAVFNMRRSTYDFWRFCYRIAVTSCHLPVLYSGHPLDVIYFLILLLQRSSQLNLSKQYQPPKNNPEIFVTL